MKQVIKTSRLAGQLEKLFRLLNEDFFEGQLDMPVITIQSTPRAYGHYSTYNAWNVQGEGRREINIGAGTLDRPIENTAATLLHEMCHMLNDTVLHVQDVSNGGQYHNRRFKEVAESHGLIVSRSERYGWSHTEPSDELIGWLIDHADDIREIEMVRSDPTAVIGIGVHTGNSGGPAPVKPAGHHRKYICPVCGNSVRATKAVHIGCLDCGVVMTEA